MNLQRFRRKPNPIYLAAQMSDDPTRAMSIAGWMNGAGMPWLLGNALVPETLAPMGGTTSDPGIYIDPATGGLVIRTAAGEYKPVSTTCWIVQDPVEGFKPVTDEDFQRDYEEMTR